MSYRVVVYAEGGLDAGAPISGIPATADLDDDELGPAHVLVRRCLASSSAIPEAAIRFRRPLRTSTGRVARGSDLLDPLRLRRLLTWPPGQAPSLAVVLVDADGDTGRKARLLDATTGLIGGLRRVIGVAVQEFEAWLIADERAAASALTSTFQTTRAPETMSPREAKGIVAQEVARSQRDPHQTRRTIAELCDLDLIATRCPAFAAFRTDVEVAAGP